jgi:hypothetical protein
MRGTRGTQKVGDGGEGGDVVLRSEFGAAAGLRLNERGEVEELGVQRFQLAVDAQMIAAE